MISCLVLSAVLLLILILMIPKKEKFGIDNYDCPNFDLTTTSKGKMDCLSQGFNAYTIDNLGKTVCYNKSTTKDQTQVDLLQAGCGKISGNSKIYSQVEGISHSASSDSTDLKGCESDCDGWGCYYSSIGQDIYPNINCDHQPDKDISVSTQFYGDLKIDNYGKCKTYAQWFLKNNGLDRMVWTWDSSNGKCYLKPFDTTQKNRQICSPSDGFYSGIVGKCGTCKSGDNCGIDWKYF